MKRLKILAMSLCTMLTLVDLPAKAAPDRDYDGIIRFMADGSSYSADTARYTEHGGICGINGGANIPRKNNKPIQVAVFECLFDGDGAIPGFLLSFFDPDGVLTATRTIVAMDLQLLRNSTGAVTGVKLFVMDDAGAGYTSGDVDLDPIAPPIVQGQLPPVTVTVGDDISVSAHQGNGKGKANRGNMAIEAADVYLVDIELVEPFVP